MPLLKFKKNNAKKLQGYQHFFRNHTYESMTILCQKSMKKYDNLVKKIPKSMKMYENFGKKILKV